MDEEFDDITSVDEFDYNDYDPVEDHYDTEFLSEDEDHIKISELTEDEAPVFDNDEDELYYYGVDE